MNMARGRTGLKAAVVALGLMVAGTTGVHASPIVTYSTSGQVGTTGVTGTPVISFGSILSTSNTSFNAPSAFSLGDFQVAPLTGTTSTTYNNTPFSISYIVSNEDGATATPVQITGVLNGTVTGNDQSTVVAKFDPISNPNFVTGSFNNTLSIFDNPLSLVPSTTHDGQTTAQAFLSTSPSTTPPPSGGQNEVPEPTSIALFITAIGGLGWKRLRRPAA